MDDEADEVKESEMKENKEYLVEKSVKIEFKQESLIGQK